MLEFIRSHFRFFGGISLLFGLVFAFCFYRAGLGLSFPVFVTAACVLLILCMKKLNLPLKRFTLFLYAVSILLACTTVFTANGTMQFLTVCGILLLLDLSLIHQTAEDARFSFLEFLLRIFKLPFGVLSAIGFPFTDCFRSAGRSRLFKNNTLRSVFFGLLAALPILGILIVLLSGADMVFSRIAGTLVNHLFFTSDPFFLFLMVLTGFIVCYAILCAAAGMAPDGRLSDILFPETSGFQTDTEHRSALPCSQKEATPGKKPDYVFLSTILACITLVYLVFCVIQILYLFAGGLFTLPEQFTYSEYARTGFFQLLFVACINFAILILCLAGDGQTKLLNILLTVMSGCTFIMIASAAYRMCLYVASYHLTLLRLLVLFFLAVLAVLMAGGTAAVYRRSFPLFFYTTAVISVSFLLLCAARPDTVIARYNIASEQEPSDADVQYLMSLSADAAPYVLSFLDSSSQLAEKYEYEAADYRKELVSRYESRGIRDFNYSFWLAARKARD